MKIALAGLFHADDETGQDEMPLGIACLTSFLRGAGYTARMFNMRAEEIDASLGDLLDFAPSLFGIQVFDETIEAAIRLARAVKQKSDGTFLVYGGRFASLDASRILAHVEWVDAVVRGEGEETVLELARALEGKKELSGIKGLSYRQGTTIRENEPRDVISDLDILPWPARDYLKRGSQRGARSARLVTSRGCVARCSFCCVNPVLPLNCREHWRGRSIDDVVDEIQHLVEDYGIRFFNIHDSSFEDPVRRGEERMFAFAKELERRRLEISWKVNFRTETFKDTDLEFIKALKRAGLDVVFLGVESGSDSDLRAMGKRARLVDNLRTIGLFRDAGVFDIIGFIMYTPYTTLEDLRRNLAFLRRVERYWCFYHYTNVLRAYRGSRIYQSLKEDGLIIDEDDFRRCPEYRFVDERIVPLARVFPNVGGRFPHLLRISSLLYDAHNIISRYYNPMNRRCAEMPDAFEEFTEAIREMQKSIGENLSRFFEAALDLAEAGWEPRVFDLLVNEHVVEFFIGYEEKLSRCIGEYLERLTRASIPIRSLYFKTWSSFYSTGKRISGI